MEILIRGGPTHKPYQSGLEGKTRDELHKRRKELAIEMKDGLFDKDQMNWHDCKTPSEENKRVTDYDRWRTTKVKGKTNDERMKEWSDINREFKRRNLEGKPQCIDFVRQRKSTKYE